MFKYDIDQEVFFIKYNRIFSGKIIARRGSDFHPNLKYLLSVPSEESLKNRYNQSVIYAVLDEFGWDDKLEDNLFSSKENLLKFLNHEENL